MRRRGHSPLERRDGPGRGCPSAVVDDVRSARRRAPALGGIALRERRGRHGRPIWRSPSARSDRTRSGRRQRLVQSRSAGPSARAFSPSATTLEHSGDVTSTPPRAEPRVTCTRGKPRRDRGKLSFGRPAIARASVAENANSRSRCARVPGTVLAIVAIVRVLERDPDREAVPGEARRLADARCDRAEAAGRRTARRLAAEALDLAWDPRAEVSAPDRRSTPATRAQARPPAAPPRSASSRTPASGARHREDRVATVRDVHGGRPRRSRSSSIPGGSSCTSVYVR